MNPKTRSHNGYLPATESGETTQKLSFGSKEVDWASSLRKNKKQRRKHKVVHFMHPKTRSHNLYLPATESHKTTQKHSFGPKEVDWACSLRKTRRNFGSTKWCILCTLKPDLTISTSRQRNRVKPPRNLVLGLNKWIGHVRCEKQDATSEAQSGAFYAPQNSISQRVPPSSGIAQNHLETLY